MRIVTWNVNSLRARLGRIERWLAAFEPDVACLQETKLADDAFPTEIFEGLGYECFYHGQGRWNGVCILSRVGLENPMTGFGAEIEPDREARLLWATCGGIRVASCYVPNGRALDHAHYQYKLSWLDRLAAALEVQASPSEPVIVCGDFNVAPEDKDVYDPKAFADSTHTSTLERKKLELLTEWGLVDLFRLHHNGDSLFSWWDYRAGSFYKHMGMRIDLLYGSPPVAESCGFALIDRNERKGPRQDPPSDHAPVFVDIDHSISIK
ncbi:MAG: exodeoxyribonuclease III [Acidimicrobiaceae bacterium]|nr:exodeoxyribonuclease III [Acidimicrobiaceae bacterium]